MRADYKTTKYIVACMLLKHYRITKCCWTVLATFKNLIIYATTQLAKSTQNTASWAVTSMQENTVDLFVTTERNFTG